ncbi:MAG: dethiobiotin synthase [Cycloclasticus sp.]|nr:dethiobiotin synthase [Cycloclasticus sp.]MBQ0789745.1 dethiobiotin synthase [Cycloclasticus sp.]
MDKGYFITGTDTDVGKTFVAAELLKALRDAGLRASGFKPVASGGVWVDGQLCNQDALTLMAESSVQLPYELVNPYCFEPAIAPHIAAKYTDTIIDFSIIRSRLDSHLAVSDVVVVEAAGGWKVPLNDTSGVDDLAYESGLPVILVVGLKLGCINHALLSEQAILDKGCQLAGWVGNSLSEGFEAKNDNIKTLKQRMKSPCLGVLEYQVNGEHVDVESRRNMSAVLDYLGIFR